MTVTVTGGEKLDARLKQIAANLRRASTLHVGWLDGETYPDGTPVALVAMANEFGNPAHGQPPRPAIRNAVAAKSGEWRAKFAAFLAAGGYDAEKALAQLGEVIRADLQRAIRDYAGPGLKPSTIAEKGSGEQLVATGREVAGISAKVE